MPVLSDGARDRPGARQALHCPSLTQLFTGKCIRTNKGPDVRIRAFGCGESEAPLSRRAFMNINGKNWLDLYVDAMLEKDPYKRLALVRQLRSVPKHFESEDVVLDEVPMSRSSRATRTAERTRRR